MTEDQSLAAPVRIEEIIFTIRGERVILDHDLAAIYGVPTKILNQAVKRNPERFPVDFVFQLTFQEFTGLRSQIVTSKTVDDRSQSVTGSRGGRRYRPYAFTEHGALMAANVLRSPQAVEMSVFVVRAFVRLRRSAAGRSEVLRRLDKLERKYDSQFRVVFDAIRQLMTPPSRKRKEIGFHVREARPVYRTHSRER